MKKQCPRTLDRPILLFGLEVEDVACVVLVVGLGSLIIGPTFPGILGLLMWVFLINFKKNKPCGYLIHFLYSKGLSLPGLIHPFKKVKKYSIR